MDFLSNSFLFNPATLPTAAAVAPGEDLNQVAAGDSTGAAVEPIVEGNRSTVPPSSSGLVPAAPPAKGTPIETDYDGVLIGNNCQALSKLNPLSLYSRKTQHYTAWEKLNSPPPSPAGVNDQELKDAWNSAFVSNSPSCQARRAAREDPKRIVYVNGINTDKTAQCETLKRIANQTCAQVIGVHNATETVGADLVQSAGDKALIDRARAGKPFPTHDGRNPAVDSLSDVIYNSTLDFRTGGGDPPPEVWAHSQGGAIASLAGYDANKRLLQSGIAQGVDAVTVKSFASAAQSWPSGMSGQHFINVQDYVPLHLGLGGDPAADRANVGPNQQVIRFHGAPGSQDPTILNPQQLVEMNKTIFVDEGGRPIKNMPSEHITAYHDINTTYLNAARKVDGGSPSDGN